MKTFIRDILAGLLLSLLIAAGIEWYIGYRQSHNNFAYKQWYLENHSEKIKILLLGNSLFENGINPHVLGDSVFDVAIAGRDIYYDAAIVRNNIDNMVNLETIIYPLSYITPYMNSNCGKKIEYPDVYAVNYTKKMHIPTDRFPESIIYSSYFLSGYWGGNRGIQDPVKKCDSVGYARLDGTFDNWFENLYEIHSMVETNEYLSADTLAFINYLKEIATLCKSHNARFIVITPPLHDKYIEATTDYGWSIISDIVKSATRDYSIEYKNYATDSIYRADSVWSNYSHLNHVGATIFARQVKGDFDLK